jgi:hypothetical protein
MNIQIPEDLSFEDLRLARDRTGDMSFDWHPIERICEASGVDSSLFREASGENVATLIVEWYQAHRAVGGAVDPAAEELIVEATVDDSRGSLSLQSEAA